ncbi:Cache 3/Cache 2 fusion domain-containing protein, partial [Hydrogenophaga sp.]|uniref:methyl-accepting chemotaxis protein n=1 Tax=Hydrogenophaga sp. TaxID=1904254 RepID=UPI0035685086
MPTPHTPTRSVARRVALQAVVMLTVVLLIVSTMVAMNAEKKAFEQVLQSVDANAKLMAGTLDAFDGAARRMTDRAYQPFRRKFGATFALDPEQQLLQNWGMSLNGDFSQVDAFSQETGGVATVFMRKGEDFERISTSVKKEDGTRALGTMLDHQHPAYARMLAGDAYTGRATLFGTPYMTHYEAVKNDAGQVVGILFIGFDITDFATSIERLVDEERYFENGGTYVIDPGRDNAAAVFVVHPTAKGAKVLDSFPDASAFLDQLRGSASVRIGNAKALFRPQTTDAWVVMRAAQSSGWWVVSEVSDQEALAGYRAVQYRFWASLIAATLVLGLALYVLVRRNVSRPLAELTKAVTSVAQGDLSHSFQSTRRDEIGRLVQEVEGMRQRFLDMLRQLRSAADSINTASVEIASGNQDLSSRTEKAAANLQQTAASVEQLTATVRQSADAASQANQLVSTAAEIATRGGEVVGQVVVTMDEINHSSK